MLFQFLETIGDLISAIIGVIMNFFSMLFTLLTAIPKAIAYLIGVIGYMPAFVGSVIIISVGIAVTITVLNHWGN